MANFIDNHFFLFRDIHARLSGSRKLYSLTQVQLIGVITLCLINGFRVFADTNSDKLIPINFKVSGVNIQTRNVITTNSLRFEKLITNSEMTFSFERIGEKWHLESKDTSKLYQGTLKLNKSSSTNGGLNGTKPNKSIPVERLLVAGCEGSDVFSWTKLVPAQQYAGSQEGERLQGSITPDRLLDPRVRGILFAFESGRSGGQLSHILPPWPTISNSMVYAKVTSFTEFPYLPEEAIFFSTIDAQSPVGFYECTVSTNFNGLRLPVEFLISLLRPAADDRQTNSESRFIVEKTEMCALANFLPQIERPIVIVDFRFADTNLARDGELVYTNSKWLPVNDPFLQGFIEKKRIEHAILDPSASIANSRSATILRVIVLMVIFFPLLFLFIRCFKKNKQTTQNKV